MNIHMLPETKPANSKPVNSKSKNIPKSRAVMTKSNNYKNNQSLLPVMPADGPAMEVVSSPIAEPASTTVSL